MEALGLSMDGFEDFAKIFSRFEAAGDDDDQPQQADIEMAEAAQKSSTIQEGTATDDMSIDGDGSDTEAQSGLSKRKLKKLNRPTVAQLKQEAERPEVIEVCLNRHSYLY